MEAWISALLFKSMMYDKLQKTPWASVSPWAHLYYKVLLGMKLDTAWESPTGWVSKYQMSQTIRSMYISVLIVKWKSCFQTNMYYTLIHTHIYIIYNNEHVYFKIYTPMCAIYHAKFGSINWKSQYLLCILTNS